MAGRGCSSESVNEFKARTGFVHSMTVRLYCACGDAEHATGEPMFCEDVISQFNDRHNKPGCEPCDPKTCARNRKKRARSG